MTRFSTRMSPASLSWCRTREKCSSVRFSLDAIVPLLLGRRSDTGPALMDALKCCRQREMEQTKQHVPLGPLPALIAITHSSGELFTAAAYSRLRSAARLEQRQWQHLLVTNVPDLAPADVVGRYKSLADIERGFRALKSEIEIGPMFHRLPERIRAHAAVCFMALILYRVMRTRLQASATRLSPECALDNLRRIQHHQVTLGVAQPAAGLFTIRQEHTDILSALTIKKPTLNTQLTLL